MTARIESSKIRSFRVEVAEGQIADLRSRIEATRPPVPLSPRTGGDEG
jgi:hypothetical protein